MAIEQPRPRTSRTRDTIADVKALARDPILLATLAAIVLLLSVFVVWPVWKVFWLSIAPRGVLSLDTYRYIFSQKWLTRSFTNSLRLGAISATTSTVVGFIFAFGLNRANVRHPGFIRQMALLPIISPPFMFCLSVILLFGRNGLITRGIFGRTNFNVYGLWSLVLVQTLGMFPIAYMVLDGVLKAINADLEDGALNLGASRWSVFTTITLPLSTPGLASSWLLVFVTSLADFANPMVLAGKYDVLSVQAYLQFTGMYNMPRGSALAILLLFPALTAFLVERYWVSRRSYVTVTGKPSMHTIPMVSRGVAVFCEVVCWITALATIMFYSVVIGGAFVKLWGVNWTPTLEHFKYAWDVGSNSIKSTVLMAAGATPITGFLAMIIAFLVVRKRFPGKGLLGFISMLGYAVPGTVVGIGYILAFNRPPLLLTGTGLIIMLCFVFREMPVGIEAGVASLQQIDPAIEEASRNLGASSGYTFGHITLPLVRPALLAGLSYSFVRSMTAVSAVIFLVSARWNHLTALTLAQTEIMRLGAASALSIFLIIIVMVAFAIMRVLVGKEHRPAGMLPR
ncbi:MAG TPA: iron ABC transporter permease [Bacillota bacterium]|nr:iron ABC transporter permease [Bacillota bacterium]